MNETNVRTPALIAFDLAHFLLARRGFPEDVELHIGFPEIADRLAHLAGTDATVEVHHG
jgi:hypothetical protein